MQRLDARVAHSGQLLSALSYRGVLARGFALVRDEQGHAVHAAAAVGPGAHCSIEFADGRVARHGGCGSAGGDVGKPRSAPKPAPREPKAAAPEARRQAGRSGQFVLALTLYRASHSATRFCESARASGSVPRWPCSGAAASVLPAIACSGRLARSKS